MKAGELIHELRKNTKSSDELFIEFDGREFRFFLKMETDPRSDAESYHVLTIRSSLPRQEICNFSSQKKTTARLKG